MRNILLLVVAIIFCGCMTTQATWQGRLDFKGVDNVVFPARPPESSLRLFFQGEPEKKYSVIGEIKGFVYNNDDITPALEEKAKSAGGDAVIQIQVSEGFLEEAKTIGLEKSSVNQGEVTPVIRLPSVKVFNIRAKVVRFE
ncbi:MAG: hypothetical protein HY761_09425 [Candidatus Omnitrophica bacterium]|nr:hypothetical protein [Candidatus Omnitrophota bacterium]